MFFISRQPGIYRKERVLGKTEYRLLIWFAVIVILPVIVHSALRGDVADTTAYRIRFEGMPDNLPGLIEYMESVEKDEGFYFFSGLIRCVFGDNSILYFFIIAFIQGIILAMVYRRFSEDFFLSLFLFMASTDYLSWMHNGIRQFMAVVIIFAATELLLKKRWAAVVFLILLASTMHQSALIMLPVVFIVQGKAWNARTLLFLFAALAAVAYAELFTDILDEMMQETQYSSMVSEWTSWGDDGTNVFRVLVYSVPTLISLVGLRYIREADDPLINLCTNMSIVSSGLYLVSMVTSGIFMGRLPIYASLYNYILLPWEIGHMFTRGSGKFVKIMLIACYMIFYTYQLGIWNG